MTTKKYTALATVHYGEGSDRKIAKAKGNGYHGVFSGLSDSEAKELLKLGAIREATKQDLADVEDGDSEVDAETVAEEPTPVAKPAAPAKTGGKVDADVIG